MKKLLGIGVAALAMIASTGASAATIIDTFDGYPGGSVPWDGSGVYTTGNSVDLVQSGTFGLTCVGGTGNCVDLSGSSPGSISRTINLAAGSYLFSFAYTGNQLGSQFPAAGFTAALGSFAVTLSGLPNNNATFTTFTSGPLTLSGPTTLSFTQNGGDPFRGSIIDNVSIAAVPEPATWGMMILGFGLIGGAIRRRRTVTARLAHA